MQRVLGVAARTDEAVTFRCDRLGKLCGSFAKYAEDYEANTKKSHCRRFRNRASGNIEDPQFVQAVDVGSAARRVKCGDGVGRKADVAKSA